MGWYEDVTGTSEYQRQSWRDNYNGGRAAGDITGSVNARLDREREAFQGATWGGSSSQPSALQVAQSLSGGSGGASAGVASIGGGGGGMGAGSSQVRTVAPGRAGTGAGTGGAATPKKGSGSGLSIDTKMPWTTMQTPPDHVPRMDRLQPAPSPNDVSGKPFPFLGIPFELSPMVPASNIIEDELGEAEFLSPGFFANWGAAIGHVDWNFNRSAQWANKNVYQPFFADAEKRVNAPIPKQEPVDWGR